MNNELSLLQARDVLRRHGIRPRKSLGQNFLTNADAREIIIKSAGIKADDVVLEIGPGLGALTERLVDEAKQVISVEIDDHFYQILDSHFQNCSNLRLVKGDILELQLSDLGLPSGYVVVANIPYNITSAVIRHLMVSKTPASRVVLTIQREVAERIVAEPGEMSLLALSVQVFGAPTIKAHISAASFYPMPKVESSVLRVDMPLDIVSQPELLDTLFKIARAGFGQKRKQLKNALAHGLPISKSGAEQLLESCGIEPRMRAEVLSVENWFCLAEAYERYKSL
ncbi:MAG: 16S rRNA (adenine(1518)-N(6)/adenine(1519)-N(6))-dimethyltransferase RsmA [Anaerolineales bacterium]|jgi:16S rRNA (adenine1518-N6/adenine1519-N6)-dimethyltransferase